jgi:hypothetical protein
MGFLTKLIVNIINIAFLLAGLLIMIFGILLLTDPSGVQSALSRVSGFNDINYIIDLQVAMVNNGILLTVVGSIIFLICFIGLVGTCSNGLALISTYLGLVLLTMIFELSVLIYASVTYTAVQMRLENLMYTALTENFGAVEISGTTIVPSSSPGAFAWENLQFTHACCGAKNYTDYQTFNWNSSYAPGASVPPSCCMQHTQYEFPTQVSAFVDLNSCIYANSTYTANVNTQGCYYALVNTVAEERAVIIIIMASLVLLEIVVLMLTVHLISARRKDRVDSF